MAYDFPQKLTLGLAEDLRARCLAVVEGRVGLLVLRDCEPVCDQEYSVRLGLFD